jgi:hypothetical protein
MDENFLKDGTRARELLACMERDGRMFRFLVFSSAEAIQAFGVENLARLGIEFLWMGAESRRETYEKNKGRDLRGLVRELRDHGVNVLVSGILFLEHHTKENIDDDIQFLTDLEGVYTQFMMFTPLPQTKLYEDYKKKGLIDFDLPFEEWHGQSVLNWHHPEFSKPDTTRILKEAFDKEFDQNSASIYRMLDTALRGHKTLSQSADPWLRRRGEQFGADARLLRLIIPTMRRFAHDELEKSRVLAAERECALRFGRTTAREKAKQFFARAIAEVHAVRTRLFGDMPQPRTRLTRFRWPDGHGTPAALPARNRLPLLPAPDTELSA